MDILDDMGASKLSAKVFLKVNYSFNGLCLSPESRGWSVRQKRTLRHYNVLKQVWCGENESNAT